MKEWFLSREPRERIILAVGAAIAVIVIAWRLVWVPLANGVERLDASVESQSRLLVDAQSAAAIPTSDASRPRAAQSLYVVVDRTARSHGVFESLTQTRQDGTTGLSVEFRAAPFDALLAWLVTLENEHGITVQTARVNRAQQVGLVNGQVLLTQY